MQTYINQLLADMQEAQNHLPPPVDYALLDPDHPAISFGLHYMVEWDNAPVYKMDDLLGIKAEQLPTVDRLTDEQVAQLIDGIYQLWSAFNLIPDVNHEAPPRVTYRVLKDYWAKKTVQYVSEGTIHLEFCHYDPEECIWGHEYCTCKEFANESMDNYQPMSDEEWQKGIVHHTDGSVRWVNPEFLDENGNFDSSKLPF